MLSALDREKMQSSQRTRQKRKVVADKSRLWPLPIPYRFSNKPQHFINASERQVVLSAMRELSALTCITFREVDSSYRGKPVLDFMKDYGPRKPYEKLRTECGLQTWTKFCFSISPIAFYNGNAPSENQKRIAGTEMVRSIPYVIRGVGRMSEENKPIPIRKSQSLRAASWYD
ncbi:metalloendopeptidase [Elysia marginata]|uniref:Metalloendopeptidase n=1 Tax=Elysia marginata TaxID=1093978 RepID=A0AAV4FB17_9GAST|nr:metalloendopeptidase [Elysia marginata]